jgi:hypothetical protein
MAEQCFISDGSNPPMCGVHHVRLVMTRTSEAGVAGIGDFSFYVCPVSGKAVDVAPKRKAEPEK